LCIVSSYRLFVIELRHMVVVDHSVYREREQDLMVKKTVASVRGANIQLGTPWSEFAFLHFAAAGEEEGAKIWEPSG